MNQYPPDNENANLPEKLVKREITPHKTNPKKVTNNPWARWVQRECDYSYDEKIWFSKSFSHQMAEISGEILRIIRRQGRIELVRDPKYIGEPQLIQKKFWIIKHDPQNLLHLDEIEVAENKTANFLSGGTTTAEEMTLLWNKYLQDYLDELEHVEQKGRT